MAQVGFKSGRSGNEVLFLFCFMLFHCILHELIGREEGKGGRLYKRQIVHVAQRSMGMQGRRRDLRKEWRGGVF